MNILTLNIGSGSQRCSVFRIGSELPADPQEPLWKASIESTFPGQVADELLCTISGESVDESREVLPAKLSLEERIENLLTRLWSGTDAPFAGSAEIDLVVHRVVHGGAEFSKAVSIDSSVETAIERYAAFAPLHNPNNLRGIKAAQRLVCDQAPHYAVFDTSFHLTIPESAAVYPGPYEWLEKGIRRYGFHGTSFRWAAHQASRILPHRDPPLRLVICHLGGGCSLAATVDGRSVDTTMGFTPLDGISMCTRSGAIDPSIVLYLLREGASVDEVEKILNKQSGLKGLSGMPGDTRVILDKMRGGDERARLAMEVFVHRLKAGIGQMITSLEAIPDALIFTDAIGMESSWVRARVCNAFGFLGIWLDQRLNAESRPDTNIAERDSRFPVLIIEGREDWEMARQCHALRPS